MLEHGALLREEQRALRAAEDADALRQQVLIEMRRQQRLVREHRVTHGTLVDHPGGKWGEK